MALPVMGATLAGVVMTGLTVFSMKKLSSVLFGLGVSAVVYVGLDRFLDFAVGKIQASVGGIGSIGFGGNVIDVFGLLGAAGVWSAPLRPCGLARPQSGQDRARKAVMIYLITGLPGNGKTLYALWHVKERAEKEGRAVFYSGIPEVKVPEWQEFDDAEKWHELPEGAIIVIDEAQRIFRPRQGRAGEPPEHIALLETHRHKGYDIYIITQHPSLIDNNVRRLSGTHRHVQRTFGAARAVIHEWGEVHLDCERRRTDSSKTVWKYPKNVYSLYKSAEIHTHKIQLPKHVWYLAICLAVLIGLVVFLKTRITERTAPVEASQPGTASGSPESFLTAGMAAEKRPMTREEYLQSFMPRIPGLQHSAPRYDAITKPVTAPIIAGCVVMKKRCQCYTQQHSRYPASDALCRDIASGNTPFYDFVSAPGEAAGARTGRADAPGAQAFVSEER